MRIDLFAPSRGVPPGAGGAAAVGVIQLEAGEPESAEAAAATVARELIQQGAAPIIEVVRHAQTLRYLFQGDDGRVCEVTPLCPLGPPALPADLARLATAEWVERVAFARRRLRRGPHQGWWCALVRSTTSIALCVQAAREWGYAEAGPRVPWSVWLRRATPHEWLEQG